MCGVRDPRALVCICKTLLLSVKGGSTGSFSRFSSHIPQFFEINALPMRSVESVEEVWSLLKDDSALSKTDKVTVVLNSGIKSKTTLF